VSGSANLLGYRARTYSISGAPDVDVGATEMKFSVTAPELDPRVMKSQVEAIQAKVGNYVTWVNTDLAEWLPTLRTEVIEAAQRRKVRLDAAAAFSDAFDVPVRSAPGARQIQVPVTRTAVRVTDRP
jgi:hypothetical protein